MADDTLTSTEESPPTVSEFKPRTPEPPRVWDHTEHMEIELGALRDIADVYRCIRAALPLLAESHYEAVDLLRPAARLLQQVIQMDFPRVGEIDEMLGIKDGEI